MQAQAESEDKDGDGDGDGEEGFAVGGEMQTEMIVPAVEHLRRGGYY